MFNLQTQIPINKIVKIKNLSGNQNLVSGTMILDDDFSLDITSSYKDLTTFQSNTFLNSLSSLTGGKVPSGQFTLQSAQVWEKTEPMEFSLDVKLYMDTSGKIDVVRPVKELMGLVLPTLATKSLNGKDATSTVKTKSLIPPGPDFATLLKLIGEDSMWEKLTENFESKGACMLCIGKYSFPNVIIKNVSPTFSDTLDENGDPVEASVSITASTMIVPTTDYINQIFGG